MLPKPPPSTECSSQYKQYWEEVQAVVLAPSVVQLILHATCAADLRTAVLGSVVVAREHCASFARISAREHRSHQRGDTPTIAVSTGGSLSDDC